MSGWATNFVRFMFATNLLSLQMMDAKIEVKKRNKSSKTEREAKLLEVYKDSLDKLQGFDYEIKKLPRPKEVEVKEE